MVQFVFDSFVQSSVSYRAVMSSGDDGCLLEMSMVTYPLPVRSLSALGFTVGVERNDG